jgi:two-component system LytT family response regulator
VARAKGHIQLRSEFRLHHAAPVGSIAEPASPGLLLIKSAGRLIFLQMSELKWVEAERDYLRLHLEKEDHFIRETMNNFQRRLDQSVFIRIHRSTIVNVHQISEIQPLLGGDYSVMLRDKTVLTLNRRSRSNLDDFLRGKLASLPRSV